MAARVSISVLVECADAKQRDPSLNTFWKEVGVGIFGCMVPELQLLIRDYSGLFWQLAVAPRWWPYDICPKPPLYSVPFSGEVWEKTDYTLFSCLGHDLSASCRFLTTPLVPHCPLPASSSNPPLKCEELSEGGKIFVIETNLYAPILHWYSLEQLDDDTYWSRVARSEYLGLDREADYTFEDEYMPPEFRTFLDALHKYKQKNSLTHLRILFWFDNILPLDIPQSSVFYV